MHNYNKSRHQFTGDLIFVLGKWSKPTGSEPNTKYEVVWSGSLSVEEG